MKMKKRIASGVLVLCLLAMPLCALADRPILLDDTVTYEKSTWVHDTQYHKTGDVIIWIRSIWVMPEHLQAALAARGAKVLLPTDETLPEGLSIAKRSLTIRSLSGDDIDYTPEGEPDFIHEWEGEYTECWRIPSSVLLENFKKAAMTIIADDRSAAYSFWVLVDVPEQDAIPIVELSNGLQVIRLESDDICLRMTAIDPVDHAQAAETCDVRLAYMVESRNLSTPKETFDVMMQILDSIYAVE